MYTWAKHSIALGLAGLLTIWGVVAYANTPPAKSAAVKQAPATTTTTQPAEAATKPIYCPDASEIIPSFCASTEIYQTNTIEGPQCLILEVGQHRMIGGQNWKLANISEPSLVNPLRFVSAFIDNGGTHCLYQTIPNYRFVRLFLANGMQLEPDFNAPDNRWRTAYSGSHHSITSTSNDTGNFYNCPAPFNQVASCPFLLPQKKTSEPSQKLITFPQAQDPQPTESSTNQPPPQQLSPSEKTSSQNTKP